MWLKVGFTVYLAILIPYYWITYTPWNFLYFCDVALFFTWAALWWEKALLASIPAVAILLPQAVWLLDLVSGARLTGMTAYMFDPDLPLFVRALSSFHGWLPVLLLWLVRRLGYDRRAFFWQCLLGTMILFISYFLAPAPPPPPGRPGAAVNINYVYGFSDLEPQQWLPGNIWFGLMLISFPLAVYWPTHLILSRFSPQKPPESEPARVRSSGGSDQ